MEIFRLQLYVYFSLNLMFILRLCRAKFYVNIDVNFTFISTVFDVRSRRKAVQKLVQEAVREAVWEAVWEAVREAVGEAVQKEAISGNKPTN